MRHWHSAIVGRVLPVLVLVVSACGGGQTGTPEPPSAIPTAAMPTPPPAATEAEARARINAALTAFDLTEPRSLNRVEDIVYAGPKGIPQMTQELKSNQLVRRWAAIYALGKTAQAQDVPLLRSALSDANLTVRARAAAALLRLGNEEGLAILRQAAASDEEEAFSAPPQLLQDFARNVLSFYGKSALLPPDPDSPRGGRTGLMTPPVRPPEDTQIHISDTGVEIDVNIQFMSFNDIPPARIETWRRGIEDMWSNKLKLPNGAPVKVVANIKTLSLNQRIAGEKEAPNFHQIYVLDSVSDIGHRSFVKHIPKPGESVGGTWSVWNSPTVVAHEVGHLMGIPDEYMDTPGGRSVPKPEYAEDNANSPSVMVQTWRSRDGKPPDVKSRHMQIILRALPGQAPAVVATPAPTATPKPSATPTPTSRPTPTPTARPSTPAPAAGPSSWKLLEPQVEDLKGILRSKDVPAGGSCSFTTTSASYAYRPAGKDTNLLVTLTWDTPPSTLVAGQTFSVTIKGSGSVKNASLTLSQGVEAMFDPHPGFFTAQVTGTGWNGPTPGASDADRAWVNVTSDPAKGDTVWGVNRTYKYTLPTGVSAPTLQLALIVGGRGADKCNGQILFRWQKQ